MGERHYPPSVNPEHVARLAALGPDWDGYGAVPLTEAALAAMRSVAIVPLTNGGFQIELHTATQDAEIIVDPDGEIEAVYP